MLEYNPEKMILHEYFIKGFTAHIIINGVRDRPTQKLRTIRNQTFYVNVIISCKLQYVCDIQTKKRMQQVGTDKDLAL